MIKKKALYINNNRIMTEIINKNLQHYLLLKWMSWNAFGILLSWWGSQEKAGIMLEKTGQMMGKKKESFAIISEGIIRKKKSGERKKKKRFLVIKRWIYLVKILCKKKYLLCTTLNDIQ